MRQYLLKQMTWENIKEISDMIDSLIVPFDDDEKTEDEVFYTEVLRQLRGQNGVPPPIEERFGFVLSCAEIACGQKLGDSRERENTLIRCFVAYELHNEGYSYSEIGKIMKRDHSTITHLAHRMSDMLSVPAYYKREIELFNVMRNLING